MKNIFYVLLSLLFFSCFTQKITTYTRNINEHRESYKEKFLEGGEQSILNREELKYVDFYKPDSLFRVEATLEFLENQDTLILQTTINKSRAYLPYAKASFRLNGEKYQLTIFQSARLLRNPLYKDYLFLPFKDLTSGEETYGGGRYLDFRWKDISGNKLIIDFNKAYNPTCAYANGYNCPLPPKENFLDTKIEAGEKTYKGDYKYD